jgi:hypothetical protein
MFVHPNALGRDISDMALGTDNDKTTTHVVCKSHRCHHHDVVQLYSDAFSE